MFLTGFLQKKDRDAFDNGEGVGGGRKGVEVVGSRASRSPIAKPWINKVA